MVFLFVCCMFSGGSEQVGVGIFVSANWFRESLYSLSSGSSPVKSEAGWKVRQAGTCDSAASACAWTKVSSRNRIQRNYKRAKIISCIVHCIVGENYEQDVKKTKNPTSSKVSVAEAGYCCSWSLHMAPPRGWADHSSHLSGSTPGPALTLTPFKGMAWQPPNPGSKWVRKPVAYLCSLVLQQGPQ